MAQQIGGAARRGPALGATVMRRLDELARFSSDAGALTRLYLTPQHKAAALQVMAWMREAGMAASIDAVGNTVGRYEARGGRARRRCCSARTSTRCGTPAATTATSAWWSPSRPSPRCTRAASACPSRSR